MDPVAFGVLAILGGIGVVLYILSIAFVWEGTDQERKRGFVRLPYIVFAPIVLLDWYVEERRRRRAIRKAAERSDHT